MKKLLIFMLILTLGYTNLFSQEAHLTFKGIPITGSFKSFEQKMKAAGFDNTYTISNDAFTGKFASHNDCTIIVNTTTKSKTVYQIMVIFKTSDSWPTVKNLYTSLKNEYTSKYGSPLLCKEEFAYPYEDGDGYESLALRSDKCKYTTIYDINNGRIFLGIGGESLKILGGGYVCVIYRDNKNNDLNKKEESQLISDDI